MISLIRQLKTKNRKNEHIEKASRNSKDGKAVKRILLPAVFLLAGAAFLYLGVTRGEMDVVLTKAINICLECIGIG